MKCFCFQKISKNRESDPINFIMGNDLTIINNSNTYFMLLGSWPNVTFCSRRLSSSGISCVEPIICKYKSNGILQVISSVTTCNGLIKFSDFCKSLDNWTRFGSDAKLTLSGYRVLGKSHNHPDLSYCRYQSLHSRSTAELGHSHCR